MRALAIALVHHPVLDGAGAIVTSAITNLDIHDLARSARTYGVERYVLVHPITAQRELAARIKEHWTSGSSAKRIPARREALARVEAVATLEDLWASFGGRDAVEVWVTAARGAPQAIGFAEGRARLEGEGKPVVILFGTAWGLPAAVLDAADARLEPVRAAAGVGDGYNHLSVRAACAISLDRLRGAR